MQDTEDTTPEEARVGWRPSRGRTVESVAVAAAALPLLVFAHRAIRDGAYPVFDDALIALRIHDVFSTHPPTVGAGTHFGLISVEAGANHPGPMPFVLLAPVYAASGFRPWGLVVALTAYHLAAVLLVAHLARRIGSTSLVVAAMGAVLVVERALGGEVFARPWNPYLALLPFLAFLFAAWAVLADRSDGALAWMAVTGSLAVQAQASFAAVVAPIAVVVGALAVVRVVRRRRAGAPAALAPLLVAALLGLAAWLLPILQQVTSDDGNLGRLARWAAGGSGSGDVVGLGRGVELLAQVAGRGLPPAVDLSASDGGVLAGAPSALVWAGAAALVGLLVLVALRWGSDRLPALGAGLALASLALGGIVAGRATPEAAASPYQLVALWVATAFALAVLVWALACTGFALRPAAWWSPGVVRSVGLLTAVVLLGLTGSALRDTTDVSIEAQRNRYRPTIEATLGALDPDDGPYLVSCAGTSRLSLCGTLILALETHGVRVEADPASTALYGPDSRWRLADPDEARPMLVVASGQLLAPPTDDARLVAVTAVDLLRVRHPPDGATTFPEEDAAIDEAVADLAAADLVIVPEDLAPLRRARRNALAIGSDGGWFRGRTVEEWQQLIDEDPQRFVRAGGLGVLADAGLLDGEPELHAAADGLTALPDRDAVWLLPPGPPWGPRS